MTRVLFVCLANICRSPMALVVARKMVRDDKRFRRHFLAKPQVVFDAAGVYASGPAERMDSRACAALQARGYRVTTKRSRPVLEADYTRFDLLLAMDHATLEELRRRCPEGEQSRLHLFLDFDEELAGREIPDPYFGDRQGFETVVELCERGARSLLEKLSGGAPIGR